MTGFFPKRRAEIATFVSANQFPDSESGVDSLLARFEGRYTSIMKESGRLHYASLAFVIVYFVKVFGFRLDLVLFDQKVLEFPYGVFLFCAFALGTYSAGIIRGVDAHIYEKYIGAICKTRWPKGSDLIFRSYIGADQWLFNVSDIFEQAEGRPIFKSIYFISALIFVVCASAIVFSPIVVGVYFLLDWKKQTAGQYVDLQYYIVLVLTLLAFMLTCLLVAVRYLDDSDTKDTKSST